MSQLSYTRVQPVAVDGALYDGAMVRDKVSALVELAAGIREGKAVKRGSSDRQVVLPTAEADITGGLINGVSFLDITLETPEGSPQPPLYSEKDAIPLIKKGRIYVRAEDACQKDGAVYVRFQNGDDVTTFDGSFSGVNTADHGLLAGAKWFTSAAAGEIAVLELNLPV